MFARKLDEPDPSMPLPISDALFSPSQSEAN
jgi:hypothetical protein